MGKNKTHAEIRFDYRSPSPPEEIHTWTILLLNRPQRIRATQQRLLETLAPTDNHQTLEEARVNGINYRLIRLDSFKAPSDQEISRAYKGSSERDSNLGERSDESLLKYVQEYVERKASA